MGSVQYSEVQTNGNRVAIICDSNDFHMQLLMILLIWNQSGENDY